MVKIERRSMCELLIILKENIRVDKNWFGLKKSISFGLCCEVKYFYSEGVFFDHERIRILDYIENNIPRYKNNTAFGWKPSLWSPRRRWLNKHIRITKIKKI